MRNPVLRLAVVPLILSVALVACGGDEEAAQPPPPEVSVVTLAPETVTLTRELPGRTNAFLVAEVRPQVNGIIEERLFTEGTVVQEGEPLYRITVDLSAQTIMAYGEARPLQIGMQLEADIMQERRKLYEWVLEPLISITGKL